MNFKLGFLFSFFYFFCFEVKLLRWERTCRVKRRYACNTTKPLSSQLNTQSVTDCCFICFWFIIESASMTFDYVSKYPIIEFFFFFFPRPYFSDTFGMNEPLACSTLVKANCFLLPSFLFGWIVFLMQTPYISVVKSVSLASVVVSGSFDDIQ